MPLLDKKVVAFGGCHLNGYMVGTEFSLLSIAYKSDTADASWIDLFSPVSVVNAAKKIELISDSREFSDCIIQLGNYETGVSLSPFVHYNYINSVSSARSLPNARGTINSPLLKAWLLSVIKVPLVIVYDFIRKPPFDEMKFRDQTLAFFELVDKKRFRKVVVLSTFFSLQPHLNIYRKRANRILKELALSFGFVWVDVFDLLEDRSKLKRSLVNIYFADSEHLNVNGHELVGNYLSKYVF